MSLWENITGWWTPGWGNFFTLTVAAAGIAVSAWFNRRTLEASDERFSQERRDARNDQLRIEFAMFSNEVEECRVQTRELGKRLWALMNRAESEFSELLESDRSVGGEIMARYKQEAQAAMHELVEDVYQRLTVRAVNVRTLTDDNRILQPMDKIQPLIDEDRHDFQVLTFSTELRELANERGRTMPERHLSRQNEIVEIWGGLAAYCVVALRRWG